MREITTSKAHLYYKNLDKIRFTAQRNTFAQMILLSHGAFCFLSPRVPSVSFFRSSKVVPTTATDWSSRWAAAFSMHARLVGSSSSWPNYKFCRTVGVLKRNFA